MKSKVAVIRTKPETVIEDIQRLCELGGLGESLDKSSQTILKDNISWHLPFPGANTTPWQLEGTVVALRNMGFENLVAVENNTVVTNPFKGEKLLLFDGIYKKYGIPVLYNFRDIKWVHYEPKFKTHALHKVYDGNIFLPEFFFGKNIVHLPTMKTHIYTTTTGAMKNAFGGLLNTKRHYTHTWIHETLVDLLHIQKEIHTGLFAIMDGTTSGEGPGPRTMIPHVTNLMLASSDMVAIDAVAAKLMGFDPMSIKYIALATEDGLGTGRPDEIEIVGDDVSDLKLNYKVGDNLASMVGDTLWFGPLKWAQWLFFRTPVVYIFVFGSFIYHDYIWYPLVGRKRFLSWLKETDWGKLMIKYAEEQEKITGEKVQWTKYL